jgi:hypothetical protein
MEDVGVPDRDADAAAEEAEEAVVAVPTNWAIALPARSAETANTRMVGDVPVKESAE